MTYRLFAVLLLTASASAMVPAATLAQTPSSEMIFRYKGVQIGVAGNGNGICEPGENSPADCNGVCDVGEEGSADCGGSTNPPTEPNPGGNPGGGSNGQVHEITWAETWNQQSSWYRTAYGEDIPMGFAITGGVPGQTSFQLGDTIEYCFDFEGTVFEGIGRSEPAPLMAARITLQARHWVTEVSAVNGPSIDTSQEETFTIHGETGRKCFSFTTGTQPEFTSQWGPSQFGFHVAVETFLPMPDETQGCFDQALGPIQPPPPEWEDLCLLHGGAAQYQFRGDITPFVPGPWNG